MKLVRNWCPSWTLPSPSNFGNGWITYCDYNLADFVEQSNFTHRHTRFFHSPSAQAASAILATHISERKSLARMWWDDLVFSSVPWSQCPLAAPSAAVPWIQTLDGSPRTGQGEKFQKNPSSSLYASPEADAGRGSAESRCHLLLSPARSWWPLCVLHPPSQGELGRAVSPGAERSGRKGTERLTKQRAQHHSAGREYSGGD